MHLRTRRDTSMRKKLKMESLRLVGDWVSHCEGEHRGVKEAILEPKRVKTPREGNRVKH